MTLFALTSHLLSPLKHGFYTRKGGASSGVFAGLNCGSGSSDIDEIVRINRTRVANHMGASFEQLAGVHQIHSADVLVVNERQTSRPKADALVTTSPDLVISVLTADCQPILLADKRAGVIAAVHAGWKGAQSGIIENTVATMVGQGATRANIAAVIGPCISQSSYEVGSDFRERFISTEPYSDQFFDDVGVQGKFLFDLAGYGLSKLEQSGIGDAEWTGQCTYLDAANFYSYRRATHKNEADYGRLISVISLG